MTIRSKYKFSAFKTMSSKFAKGDDTFRCGSSWLEYFLEEKFIFDLTHDQIGTFLRKDFSNNLNMELSIERKFKNRIKNSRI